MIKYTTLYLAQRYWRYHDVIGVWLICFQEPQLLIDLKPLFPSPKIVPPLAEQLPNESQRFWGAVSNAIKNKQYNEATRLKQELEERQREKATKRKETSENYKPRFFKEVTTPSGRAHLTEDGKQALQGLQEENYSIPSNDTREA